MLKWGRLFQLSLQMRYRKKKSHLIKPIFLYWSLFFFKHYRVYKSIVIIFFCFQFIYTDKRLHPVSFIWPCVKLTNSEIEDFPNQDLTLVLLVTEGKITYFHLLHFFIIYVSLFKEFNVLKWKDSFFIWDHSSRKG